MYPPAAAASTTTAPITIGIALFFVTEAAAPGSPFAAASIFFVPPALPRPPGSLFVDTRVLGRIAVAALSTAPIICVASADVGPVGMFSTAFVISRPNSGAVWYRSDASRASALSITRCNSSGHATPGFISESVLGWSVNRMIIVSCAESLWKGNVPVRQLNATRASE